MFDSDIHRSSNEQLERMLRLCGGSDNVGALDLGVRVAKELRYRRRFGIEIDHDGNKKNVDFGMSSATISGR